jgi:plasmid stabilization system protein ParE
MKPAAHLVSAEAQNDLFEIWTRIADDSVELANRIDREFQDLFTSLARMPGQGHTRRDFTSRPVLFFPRHSFLVAYQPDTEPLRIFAVLRGRRNINQMLKERS